MKKMPYMSAAKKARIALAVMAVCGFTLSGAQSAFAENVTIDANKNIICGEGAMATGSASIALGTYAESNGEKSVAIGSDSKAEGNNALALGVNSQAKEENTIALGRNATAGAADSTSIGYHSEAGAKGSLAIGAYTDVSHYAEYSVAIGVGSYAGRANSISVGGGWLGNGPQYRQITNVADGTEEHDAATYGQILKKDTYTITINNEGNGETKLVTNASEDGPTITIDASALNTKITENANAIGTLSSLTTTEKGNLVGAVNEVKGTADTALDLANTNKANIGSLSADGKHILKDNNISQNLVVLDEQVDKNKQAINNITGNITNVDNKIGDLSANGHYILKANNVAQNLSAIDDQVYKNEIAIGTLSSLTTTEKGNLVGAVNEVKGTADTALVLANTNKASIGSLSADGTYIKKAKNVSENLVALDTQVKTNAEDIKTVNGRVDELGGRVDTIGGAVSKLDTKVNKVGAGAAALAALHPMDFDPDNKLSFAAGVGSYHGASAVAIGAFYRPSEQVMFSISGNMGNGENMVNAGVSFALDRPSKTPTTKAALVKTVAAQNEQIAALKETVSEQNEKIARLEAMVEKLATKQST